MRRLVRRRTVRSRFTALYAVLFFLSGAVLLGIANFASVSGSSTSAVAPGSQTSQAPALAQAQARIAQLEAQLDKQDAAQTRQLLLGSVVALCVMALASVVLGRLLAVRVLRPLRTVTAATRRITAENLHERLAVPGPTDEVKDLADTIDDLLERLEGAFAAQRRFVANASHELRTPLATMRASLDVALAKPDPVPAQTIALAGRIRTELDQVDHLLESLLALARTQHGNLPGQTTLSLGRLVSTALAARAADISAKELTVHDAVGRDDLWVTGSRPLLRRMIDNLIDNAIAHNRPGGWIHIATGRAAGTGGVAWFVVETSGPVLDQAQVARLGQPFQRLGADRTGSGDGAGLGLSIVAAIVRAHGGGLELRARPEGGLRAGITLPLAVEVPA